MWGGMHCRRRFGTLYTYQKENMSRFHLQAISNNNGIYKDSVYFFQLPTGTVADFFFFRSLSLRHRQRRAAGTWRAPELELARLKGCRYIIENLNVYPIPISSVQKEDRKKKIDASCDNGSITKGL